jgi:hypothetical protein
MLMMTGPIGLAKIKALTGATTIQDQRRTVESITPAPEGGS